MHDTRAPDTGLSGGQFLGRLFYQLCSRSVSCPFRMRVNDCRTVVVVMLHFIAVPVLLYCALEWRNDDPPPYQ